MSLSPVPHIRGLSGLSHSTRRARFLISWMASSRGFKKLLRPSPKTMTVVAVVDRVEIIFAKVGQRKAQIGIIVARRIVVQHALDRTLRSPLREFGADVDDVVDEHKASGTNGFDPGVRTRGAA